METGFPSSGTHESRNQTPVLFDALQVDERTDEGGGEGRSEEKQVRHRALVPAICSQRRQREKRKRRKREVQRGKFSACEDFFDRGCSQSSSQKKERTGRRTASLCAHSHLDTAAGRRCFIKERKT